MIRQKQLRPSADKTRKKILQMARKLFLEYGFAGTSMGTLAGKLGINQSLIFHHFRNKKNLWVSVKAEIISEIEDIPIDEKPESLTVFLLKAVSQRCQLYEQKPELIRLMLWQRLEGTELSGGTILSPDRWLAPINYLQQKKELNPKLDPQNVLLWLFGSINSCIFDEMGFFRKNPQAKKIYLEMLIEKFELVLKN